MIKSCVKFLKVICLLLFSSFVIYSCARSTQRVVLDTSNEYKFPDDWMGGWQGELVIWNEGKESMKIPMKVINKPTQHPDTLLWALVYGEDETKGLREYYLIKDSIDDNHFVVDERNSIFLDGYVSDNVYLSTFNVMGNQITSIYRLLNEKQMMFEIVFNKDNPVSITGNTVINGDTIPSVKSFPIKTYQRAILNRF